MSARDYCEREMEIIRKVYPAYGPGAVADAMRAEGFIRTEESIKVKARSMGVRRDRTKMEHDGAWNDEELKVIKQYFPLGGAELATEKLVELGYDRTIGAVTTRASMLGIRNRNTKRRMVKKGDRKIVNIILDTKLDKAIIHKLESQRNRSEYIRRLIMEDIRRGQQ